MFPIHLVLAFVSVGVYLLARTRLPRQVLIADGVYVGILMFFVGAYDGAIELHYLPGSREVLDISTVSLLSAAFAFLLLPVAYRGMPSLIVPARVPDRWILVSVGLFITLFNSAFSYLVFVKLLKGSFSILNTEAGLLSIRKLIATGEQGYFFPGLVKQVRDVLAPAYLFFVLAYTKKREYRVLTTVVGASTLFAIFLGGQRMPLLVMGWAFYAGQRTARALRTRGRARKTNWTRTLGMALIAIPALAGINALLGRSEEAGSLAMVAWNTAFGVFDRLVLVVPLASIESFQFVTASDIGFAELWIADLMSLAPGTQTGFSNQLHSYLGGSFAGNVVLGLPVNAYFNAGWFGAALVPSVWMFFAAAIDRLAGSWRDPYVASARCVLLAYSLIFYDPFLFLLNGGLMFLAVLGAVFLLAKRASGPARHEFDPRGHVRARAGRTGWEAAG